MHRLINTVLTGLLLLGGCGRPAAESPVAVPAVLQAGMVAGLQRPLDILVARYREQQGVTVLPTYANRTQLAQQLAAGAPYDLLVAESVCIGALAGAGRLDSASMQPLAEGVLAVLTADSGLLPADLRELAGPRYGRIAVPDPEQTVYGAAARAACTNAGIWEQLRPRLVFSRNAPQAAAYADKGEVAAAFVPLASAIERQAPYYLVPSERYPSIMHAMALAAATPRRSEAKAFLAYLLSPECRTVWEACGFRTPPPAGTAAGAEPRLAGSSA